VDLHWASPPLYKPLHHQDQVLVLVPGARTGSVDEPVEQRLLVGLEALLDEVAVPQEPFTGVRNVAVIFVVTVTVVVQGLAGPLQPPPDQPEKVEPVLADAVRVTEVPLVTVVEAVEQPVPQLIPAGEVTVPKPVPALVTVRTGVLSVKVAVIVVVAVITVVQVPVPEQPPPDQPEKVELVLAVAVRMTEVPEA
jgi:hypothetical protein